MSAEASLGADQVPDGDGSAGHLAREYVLTAAPFTVRRRVRWSECDPAGVVFAGNYTEYLMSAVDLFKRHLQTSGYLESRTDRRYHTPLKALNLVYMGSLWPDDVFDMVVYAGDVRTHTSDILVEGRRADDGRPVFAGRLTSVYVSTQDRTDTVKIPDNVRQVYTDYRARVAVPEALSRAVAR